MSPVLFALASRERWARHVQLPRNSYISPSRSTLVINTHRDITSLSYPRNLVLNPFILTLTLLRLLMPIYSLPFVTLIFWLLLFAMRRDSEVPLEVGSVIYLSKHSAIWLLELVCRKGSNEGCIFMSLVLGISLGTFVSGLSALPFSYSSFFSSASAPILTPMPIHIHPSLLRSTFPSLGSVVLNSLITCSSSSSSLQS